jgi:hypothetical protein
VHNTGAGFAGWFTVFGFQIADEIVVRKLEVH